MSNFSKKESQLLEDIMIARRDIRGNNFKSDKIEKESIEKILKSALLAPSVGYSQPWKFVVIENQEAKDKIYKNFKKELDKSQKYFEDRPLY